MIFAQALVVQPITHVVRIERGVAMVAGDHRGEIMPAEGVMQDQRP